MVGFKLKPKNEGNQPKKLGFSFKKTATVSSSVKKTNLLNHDSDEEEEGVKKSIDTFDISQGGGISSTDKPKDSGPMVIKVESESFLDILKRKTDPLYRPIQHPVDFEVPEEEKLQYGLNKMQSQKKNIMEEPKSAPQSSLDQLSRTSLKENSYSNKLIIPLNKERASSKEPEDPFEQYNEVPVEEFGAALLRGMGWNGKFTKEVKPQQAKPRRGNFLGIGAKDEGLNELQDYNEELYVPVSRRDIKTGEIVSERETDRERSPERKGENYRTRGN